MEDLLYTVSTSTGTKFSVVGTLRDVIEDAKGMSENTVVAIYFRTILLATIHHGQVAILGS